jgi:hypothetical protein
MSMCLPSLDLRRCQADRSGSSAWIWAGRSKGGSQEPVMECAGERGGDGRVARHHWEE